MKPISRRLKAALPSLIIVPAMIQMASAAIQATNTGDGNLTIVSGTNLADSINANGPLDPATQLAPYTVTIQNGATLTGDTTVPSPAVVNVSVADYTVNNSGVLNATAGAGIISAESFTLTNSNTITGTTNGVEAVEAATITNSGTISGVTGILTTGGDAVINNSGTITGTGGTALQLGDTAGVGNNTVTLSNGGTINGAVTATGTGNVITASNDVSRIYGDVSGIDSIEVNSGGYLYGEGLWETDINVASGGALGAEAATSGPLYDYGVLEIDGNVIHQTGSIISVGIQPGRSIANDGTTSTIIRSVGGTYNATGAEIDLYPTDYVALLNGDYLIVENAGGNVVAGNNTITYRGSSESVAGNYFSTLSTATGDLVLRVDHNYEGLPGLTENQGSLGAAFDTFMDNEGGLPDGYTYNNYVRNLVGDLDAGTLENAQGYLARTVAPTEAALGVASSAMNSNYRLHRMTQDHLASARNSGETVTTTHTAAPVTDSKGGMISGGETTTSTSSVGSNGNLWGAYSYDDQNNNDFLNGGSYDGEAQSFTAGFDYRVAPNLLLGILVDGTENDVDIAGSTATTESIRAALYGTYGASTGLYVDFLAGYGSHDLDLTDATSIQALTTVGFAMGDDRVKHGPYLGAEYQNMDADGFSYSGLVNVDDFHSDSLRGLIGYRVNANLGTFRPYASVAYAHEFRDDQPTASASFLGLPFQVKGAEAGSSVLVGAGTGISLNQSLVLDLGYRGEFTTEGDGLDTHGGTIGLNYAF